MPFIDQIKCASQYSVGICTIFRHVRLFLCGYLPSYIANPFKLSFTSRFSARIFILNFSSFAIYVVLYNVLNGICLWILWVCSRWCKKGGKERDEQLMSYLFFAAINYAANQNIRLAQCAQNCSVVIVMSMATVYLRSCRVRISFLFLMKERNGSSTYRVHNIKWYLLEQISLVQCTLTWTQW